MRSSLQKEKKKPKPQVRYFLYVENCKLATEIAFWIPEFIATLNKDPGFVSAFHLKMEYKFLHSCKVGTSQ